MGEQCDETGSRAPLDAAVIDYIQELNWPLTQTVFMSEFVGVIAYDEGIAPPNILEPLAERALTEPDENIQAERLGLLARMTTVKAGGVGLTPSVQKIEVVAALARHLPALRKLARLHDRVGAAALHLIALLQGWDPDPGDLGLFEAGAMAKRPADQRALIILASSALPDPVVDSGKRPAKMVALANAIALANHGQRADLVTLVEAQVSTKYLPRWWGFRNYDEVLLVSTLASHALALPGAVEPIELLRAMAAAPQFDQIRDPDLLDQHAFVDVPPLGVFPEALGEAEKLALRHVAKVRFATSRFQAQLCRLGLAQPSDAIDLLEGRGAWIPVEINVNGARRSWPLARVCQAACLGDIDFEAALRVIAGADTEALKILVTSKLPYRIWPTAEFDDDFARKERQVQLTSAVIDSLLKRGFSLEALFSLDWNRGHPWPLGAVLVMMEGVTRGELTANEQELRRVDVQLRSFDPKLPSLKSRIDKLPNAIREKLNLKRMRRC